MGKAVAFAVVSFTLLGTYYSAGRQDGMMKSTDEVVEHQQQVVARAGALTGYNIARQRLADDFTQQNFSGAHGNGSYTVATTVVGDRAEVEVASSVTNASGDPVGYTVLAEFDRVGGAMSQEVPMFMRYALISDDNLTLNGNILGDILVTGDARATLNANMHTNANMHITGNSVEVKGFGTFVGNGTSNPNSALQGSFTPNYNPLDEDGAQQAPTIDIPDFDAADFISKVTVDSTVTGDVSLFGSYDFGGTREDPYIWHITGNLTTTGSTTISGYAMFIVEGNIVFNGNMQAGTTGYAGPDESSMAFYSDGRIELGGNTQVYGQLFAQRNVIFMHGTPDVYGTITTKGSAELRGTPKIYYREASPGLTTIWEEPATQAITLVAYSEW